MPQLLLGFVPCTPFGPSKGLVVLAYAGSVIIFTVMAIRNYRVAVALRLPALLTTCVLSGLLLYLSMLVPGALKILMPLPVFLTLTLVALVISRAFSDRGSVETANRTDSGFLGRMLVDRWRRRHIILIALGTLAVAPLLYFIAAAPFVVLSRGWPLPWDTVSYHLPGFIGFLQECSLWRIDFAQQSYSFGLELIGGYPAAFFPSHWGFVVAHCYVIVFMVVAILLVVDVTVRTVGATTDRTRTLACILSIAFWCLLFREQLWAIGKNDIFMAACLFAMFGLLLEDIDHAAGNLRRQNAVLFVASSAMALAVATKPPSLAYTPLYAGLAFNHLRSRTSRSRLIVALQCSLMLGAVLAVGGFFDIRNLLAFGSLVHPKLASYAPLTSIRMNLLNPQIYAATRDATTFVVAALSITLLAALRPHQTTGFRPAFGLLSLIIFHLTGLGAFVMSPWVVISGYLNLRLWMAFFVFAGILWSIAITRWIEGWRLRVPLGALVAAGMILVLSFLPWWWSDRTARGLPGYEQVKGLPTTEVYRWIQKSEAPLRILTTGLFPYGLYGTHWANRVVAVEPDKILSTIEAFRPDLIVVGVYELGSEPGKPSIIAWLRREPLLREVYCDETASVFEVLRDERMRDEGRRFLREFRLCPS